MDIASIQTFLTSYAKDLLNAETSAVYLLAEKTGRMNAIAATGEDSEKSRTIR